MFGRKKESAVKLKAQQLSTLLLELSSEDRERAGATVRGLVMGVRNLGQLPEGITSIMVDILLAFGRKIMMGQDASKLMDDLTEGLHPDVRAWIEGEAKS